MGPEAWLLLSSGSVDGFVAGFVESAVGDGLVCSAVLPSRSWGSGSSSVSMGTVDAASAQIAVEEVDAMSGEDAREAEPEAEWV